VLEAFASLFNALTGKKKKKPLHYLPDEVY